ncbi:MFS transporter [Piscinibacter sp. XHJ-5]|uniref:MFS transporter n=1 Tax=Piscinibacter sp. XHJ-5 TaxID=3037797 RepID=UPI002452976B|nr:MFS transporter [Piscinibacter sp. XHJ-5]
MKTQPTALSASLDVQQFIDHRRFSAYQALVFALCFLIMVADGFDTAAMGFVVPALTGEWGVARHAFGSALSASLVGLAIGALASGPIADRFGRKPVLLVSVALFGIFSLATVYASSLGTLTVLRFITGLGLGAATPNATTLLAECVPARRRALLLNGMFCGFTLGAAAGGFAAAAIMPAFGWRGVFLVGGVVPLLLVVVSAFALPESIRFMIARGRPTEQVKAALRRLTGVDEIAATRFSVEEGQRQQAGRSPVVQILSGEFRVGTPMLWLAYFMGVLVLYLITSWMPTLIKDSGVSLRNASMVAALFPLGGTLGAIACGWLMDRRNPHRIIAGAFFIAGLLMLALAQALGHPVALSTLTFASGLFTGAGIVSMPALAALYYPTQARASGVAWMLGIGRLGGILGAAVGGVLLQAGLGTSTILAMLAVPAVIAAAAVVLKDSSRSARPAPAVVGA